MSSFKFYMLIGFFLMSHICFAAAASLDRVTQGFEDFDEPQEIFQVISKLYKLSQDGSEYKISKNYDKLRYWLSAKACTNLMNSHRIHSLNDKNKNRLAEKMGVQDADKSKFFESIQRYKGFFVPQLGRIFSPASRSRDSINETLMHECIHAYQYLYRLPLDIEALKKSQLLKEEEFVSYLSFYYETEAHWLMHKFSAPKVWVNFAQTQKEGSFAKFLRVVGNAGTVGLANVAGSKSYNDSVPLPDKIGSYDGLSNSNAYWCSMPSSVPQSSFLLTFMGGFRFNFQATFLESLQKAQFENRAPFLFSTDGIDRKIFNLLTDHFYTQSDKIKEYAADDRKTLADSLLIPDIGVFSIADRPQQENVQRYNFFFKKVASEIYKGGEGSSPEIDFSPINQKIMPHLELQPQISFDPIQRNESYEEQK